MGAEASVVEHVHGPDCPCTRCVGFQPGNDAAVGHDGAVVHGAYATQPGTTGVVRFGEYVLDVASAIRAQMVDDGIYSPAFEFTIESLAIATWRRDVAATALDGAKPGEHDRLEQNLRGWINSGDKLATSLGLTPSARARLGLDVALKRKAESLIDLASRARAEGELADQAAESVVTDDRLSEGRPA